MLLTFRLVACNFKRISLDRCRICIRIVAVKIYLGIIVLVEDVIVRYPFSGIVVRKSYIVGLIVFDFECAWSLAAVVDNIDADLVCSTEAVSGHPCRRLLEDVAVDGHLVGIALRSLGFESRFVERTAGHCHQCHRCDQFSLLFHIVGC